MDNQIQAYASAVAELREQQAQYKAELDASYQAWIEQNQSLNDILSTLKDTLAEAEADLREIALTEYTATNAKKLPCGIGIRVTTKLEYDEAAAFAWATEHKMALALDKKAFEKIAKASPLPFVEEVETPTVTLPTDTAKLRGE
jgi:uncharacterized coiled-coil DUF342 family protein